MLSIRVLFHQINISGFCKVALTLKPVVLTSRDDLMHFRNGALRNSIEHLNSGVQPRTEKKKPFVTRSQSSIFPAFTFFIFPQAFSSIKERFLWRAVPFVRLIHFKCKNSNLLRLLGLVCRPLAPPCASLSRSGSLAEKVKQRLIRTGGWVALLPSADGKQGGVDGSAMQMRRTC